MPIYGDGPAGAITCVLLAASAVGVGILRIAADKHWMTDVLTGYVVGGQWASACHGSCTINIPLTPDLSSLGVKHVAWVPSATPSSGSLSLLGVF